MTSRRALLTAGIGFSALALITKFGEAETMTTSGTVDYRNLSDADWRQRLTANQYAILRQHGTERAGTSPLNNEKRKGIFACAGCDLPLFLVRYKIREWHRLAQFLSAIGKCGRDKDGSFVFHGAHGSALRALPRSSRSRVRRRTKADRLAVLHEWRGDEIHAGVQQRVLSLLERNHLFRIFAD